MYVMGQLFFIISLNPILMASCIYSAQISLLLVVTQISKSPEAFHYGSFISIRVIYYWKMASLIIFLRILSHIFLYFLFLSMKSLRNNGKFRMNMKRVFIVNLYSFCLMFISSQIITIISSVVSQGIVSISEYYYQFWRQFREFPSIQKTVFKKFQQKS